MFRRLMIAVLVFAMAVPAMIGSASAADHVFKYANTQSENHPRSKSMVYFKEQLEKRSDGKIKVELYFSGTLGKESEVLEMVKLGNLQGCRGGLFERANKKYLMYTLPFMFANADQVVKVMNSDLGKEINQGAMANGFYVPATGVAGGMRQPTNKVRPITSVADLKGLKLRTPPIDVTIRTFKELGANPQQVPYTETYMALKTGVVDGQENPFSNCVDMKFYEVQKYLSVLNWQVHPDPFYVNPAWYKGLPADLQKVFDEVSVDTMNYSNKIWLASEDGYYETLKGKLEVNVLEEAAYKEFVEAVKPVWQYYVDQGDFTWDDINRAQKIAQ
ncbi:TRAP transporter substrate-binding protein [Pseudodesulfovibrio portus]|uniref:ABC transporter substrate-binding protein n=1 Tax=Pseudodesulfovibrio portus TaxID=231439 RepID=A0ABN6RZT6_9BACT|nr:TRAP transporter substrate-binding protein [Pseudodesulfovibrio portus]BDQ35020.1 ABC transporter substrate-binding protein [Pseudodesulfovibrio portus]